MTYKLWNQNIAKHFFNESMAGREVLLYVNEEEINKIGYKFGQNSNDFVESVKNGPWAKIKKRKGICQEAYDLSFEWRQRYKYPPYLAYLAFFVFVSSTNDNSFSQSAYYPKLRKLLGEEEVAGQYPLFDRMVNLWSDLEHWSKEDKLEELGAFNLRIRGGWRHVGIPLSQTILSNKERKMLPFLFFQIEDILTDFSEEKDELINAMLTKGSFIFSKKTIKLLNKEEKNNELLNALVELVVSDFKNWDGTIPETFFETNLSKKQVNLKLGLRLDKGRSHASFNIRVNTKNNFPEEELNFKTTFKSKDIYTCRRSVSEWSTPLKIGKELLSPFNFDISNGIKLSDDLNNWTANMKGSKVRVFMQGHFLGLPDFIEVPNLLRGSKFILLCTDDMVKTVRDWALKSCEKFGPVQYTGVPKGWSLFQGINPHESCESIDKLRFPSEVIVRFVEGIRLGNGNNFLENALPKIQITNITSAAEVHLNNFKLEKRNDDGFYEISENAELKDINTLIVKNNNIIRKANFKVTKSKIAIRNKEQFEENWLNKNLEKPIYGYLSEESINDIPKIHALPTHLSKNITFIGKNPGEILDWNRNTQNQLTWDPVWAVYKKKRNWFVYYCSTVSYSNLKIGKPISDRRLVKNWKTFLITMERKAIEPKYFELNQLWRRHIEVAKNIE